MRKPGRGVPGGEGTDRQGSGLLHVYCVCGGSERGREAEEERVLFGFKQSHWLVQVRGSIKETRQECIAIAWANQDHDGQRVMGPEKKPHLPLSPV